MWRNRRGTSTIEPMNCTFRSFVRLVLVVLFVLAFVAGCASAGVLVTERRSVETEEAESVSADLSMRTGNMTVGGGAENLMDVAA